MKTKLPKPQTMWAIYNYGQLMTVEFRRKDLAHIFIDGMPEMKADIKNGSMSVMRVTVSPITRKMTPIPTPSSAPSTPNVGETPTDTVGRGRLKALIKCEDEFRFIREELIRLDAGVSSDPYTPDEWRNILLRRRQIAFEIRNDLLKTNEPK